MKHYPTFAIEQFGKHIFGDVEAFNWLINNNYRELVATLDAIRDDRNAFKYLIEGNHYELAAFVNAIWDDTKAFEFLIKVKAFDWAACANFINGDDKAEQALRAAGKSHFVAVAHAILGRIHEDGDRNTSPAGVIRNMFDFKKYSNK